MGIGMFHTVCDHCQSQSEEYGNHVVACKECDDEVCETCAREGDYQSGPDNWAVCWKCKPRSPLAQHLFDTGIAMAKAQREAV